MKTLDKLTEIKRTVEEMESQKQRLQGQLDAHLAELKARFGVDTEERGMKLFRKLNQEMEQQEAEINEYIQQVEQLVAAAESGRVNGQ